MHVTVKLLEDRCGNLILSPSKQLTAQIKDRVNDATVLSDGVFLNHGIQTRDFFESLTPSQRRKIARDANSRWPIGLRINDEQAWCLFGAEY